MLVPAIEPRNKHDSRLFSKLYEGAKKMFTFGFEAKYLADSASDSSKVKQTLRYDNVIPVIARNGRCFRKSEEPRQRLQEALGNREDFCKVEGDVRPCKKQVCRNKEGHNTRIFMPYRISHKVCDIILWI